MGDLFYLVRVGHLRPRFFLVPSQLPEFASALFEYVGPLNEVVE